MEKDTARQRVYTKRRLALRDNAGQINAYRENVARAGGKVKCQAGKHQGGQEKTKASCRERVDEKQSPAGKESDPDYRVPEKIVGKYAGKNEVMNFII
ncbi:MAG: hypothetical protein LBU06_09130 [Desulfovibrio sp.]|nr:hypothetical protein [Desulfovibrio sp.]